MAGRMVKVLPKCRLDYQVAGGQTQRIALTAKPIDVTQESEGSLLLRVHALDSVASGHIITIKVVSVAPSSEDPGLLFWMVDAPVATVVIDSSTPVPSGDVGTLLTAPLSDNFGGFVVLVAEGYRPASPSTLKATISACLSLKGARSSLEKQSRRENGQTACGKDTCSCGAASCPRIRTQVYRSIVGL